jgi:hypothetical protein
MEQQNQEAPAARSSSNKVQLILQQAVGRQEQQAQEGQQEMMAQESQPKRCGRQHINQACPVASQ